ncbi:MAG: 5-dehydro-4-deoxy-D-glucuronate isomerase [Spirochaetes bacterium]|nr:5-dehydro-4-deoxy-D-glucuronate isomerase [Spirochaetota bacterium]
MQIRDAVSAKNAKNFDTGELRENFLIENLFVKNKLNLTYSFYDRVVVGGASPADKIIALEVDEKIMGTKNFLDRREMGIINVGGPGTVVTDSGEYELGLKDCLYLGLGTTGVKFKSSVESDPAKFYIISTPAHTSYPAVRQSINEAVPTDLGSDENSNKRTIYKYIHPEGIKSCQLVMGLTIMATNNVWNTMPPHTHQRRMEVYFYFNVSSDDLVFHYMGEPGETRHVVMRNEEAILSPSWSVHSGVGTKNYTFIWAMAGENQIFSDMDGIKISDIK